MAQPTQAPIQRPNGIAVLEVNCINPVPSRIPYDVAVVMSQISSVAQAHGMPVLCMPVALPRVTLDAHSLPEVQAAVGSTLHVNPALRVVPDARSVNAACREAKDKFKSYVHYSGMEQQIGEAINLPNLKLQVSMVGPVCPR
ncbi:MAG: hypothetical protein ACOYNL_01855 [Rickettsiales bacterium]